MTQRWIIGLASGCSGDGIDAALIQIGGLGLEIQPEKIEGIHQPFGPEMREQIRRLDAAESIDPRHLGRLHRLLGESYASAARSIVDAASLSFVQVLAMGCLGYPVGQESEGRFPGELSLGMSAVLAERTGVTVVSDFRDRDLAAGGQGAPLGMVPDYILFRHPSQGRLLVHLGGISRLVYLPPGAKLPELIGFEAGPCNLLLNAMVRRLSGGREGYDSGGKHAVQGRCIEPLLQTWLAHSTLQRRPPRRISRYTFGEAFADQAVSQLAQHGGTLHDLLCTATHFVARCISSSVRRFLPPSSPIQEVLISGGGVRNGFLLHLLQQQLKDLPLIRTDDRGVPALLRRAVSQGLLAALTLDGVPANAPAATGAVGSRLLGSLTPGSAANWAKCLQWLGQHAEIPAHLHDL